MKAPSLRRFSFGVATLVAFSAACAQGTNIVDGSGGNGGSGSGPSSASNVTTGSGGASSSNGSGGSSSDSSTSTTTSASSGQGGASSSSSASTTTSTTTSASSTTSSSSTGGGPVDCDPLNPGPGCGANMHCEPTTTGDPECTPAGSGIPYDFCVDNTQCGGPLECVFDGFDACCMRWCTSNSDCGLFEACEPLGVPVYVGTTSYGVCWDGFPCFF